MTTEELWKALCDEYHAWIKPMHGVDAVNSAYEIAFVKRVIEMLEDADDADVPGIPDDIDPAWLLDETIEYAAEFPVSGNIFSPAASDAIDLFKGFMTMEFREWEKYKGEHARRVQDGESH